MVEIHNGMSRNLFFAFFTMALISLGTSVSKAEEDIRYLSAEDLQKNAQQTRSLNRQQKPRSTSAVLKRAGTSRKSSVSSNRRNTASSAVDSSSRRPSPSAERRTVTRRPDGQASRTSNRKSGEQVQNRRPSSQRQKASFTNRKSSSATAAERSSSRRRGPAATAGATVASARPQPPIVRQRVVRDTLERLEEAIPSKKDDIVKSIDVIDHIRTYYIINRGADIKDLQKDKRFQEIYEDMSDETKMLTYLYLKGLYENSPQAITDKAEKNVKSISELSLNRKFSPTKTDIDGFNEKTSIKSKLVRKLSGTYSRSKPAAPSKAQESMGAESID